MLVDCPYELYWFDKTWYGGSSYSISYNSTSVFLQAGAMYILPLSVAVEYSADGQTQYGTDFNTSVADRILKAADNAKAVVAANAGKADYAKLRAYLDDICARVGYNDDAADDENDTPYGNPWQLIWVFDDDDTTNVVCEGYAKAFKYLCDLSDFRSNVSASIVSGDMAGGTGAGPHMWNLVTMSNGKRYLVDVTNCDSGTIGSPDELFMAGYTRTFDVQGSYSTGETFTVKGYAYLAHGQEITYIYDVDMSDLYTEEELTVASENYDPETDGKLAAPVISDVTFSNGLFIGGELTANISVPQGAEMVYVEFGQVDDEDTFVPGDYWDQLYYGTGAPEKIRILGFHMYEAGVYELRAQAWTHDFSVEVDDTDSEIAVYRFTLSETSLPAMPEVISSAQVGINETFTYTVPGAEAVTEAWYNEDSGSGTGMPMSYTLGEKGTVSFDEEGQTIITVWARFNGVWAPPAEVAVYVGEASPFTVKNGVITGYTGTESVLVIPEEIYGQTITGIGDFAFYDYKTLTSVTLPGTLVSLGDGAFCNTGLKSVQIAEDVEVKTWYFYEPDQVNRLPRLYSVDLPTSIQDPDKHAPFLLTAMESIVPDFVTPDQLTQMETEAFSGTAATFIWLTDGVASIGDGAFANCKGLHFVRIPYSCHSIGEKAIPAGTVLLVNWGSDAYYYAIEQGYPYITYSEGFNG